MFRKIVQIILIVFALVVSADNIDVKLFIMSKCPYGVGAQKVILDLKKKNLPGVNYEFHYICNYDGKNFSSLHGEGEVEEDLRQIVILNYFKDRANKYILSRIAHFEDDNWRDDAVFAGIPVDSLEKLVKTKGRELLAKDAKLVDSLGISASPTLMINDRFLTGWHNDFPTLYMILGRATGVVKDMSCYDDIECFTPIDTLYGHCSYRENGGVCQYEYAFEVDAYVLVRDKKDHSSVVEIKKNLQKYFPRLNITVLSPGDSLYEYLNDRFHFRFLPLALVSNVASKMYSFNKFKAETRPVQLDWEGYWITTARVKPKYLIESRKMPDTLVLCVMSYCPFGNNAIRNYLQSFADADYNLMENSPGLYLRFIVNDHNGEIVSLHGEEEVKEDMIQAVIQKHFPGKFLKYLGCRTRDVEGTTWQECAVTADIDTAVVDSIVKLEGEQLLMEDARYCQQYSITASPTYIWENKRIISGIDELKNLIESNSTAEK